MVPIQPAPVGCVLLILALIGAPLLLFLGVDSTSTMTELGPIYEEFGVNPLLEDLASGSGEAGGVPPTPASQGLPSR